MYVFMYVRRTETEKKMSVPWVTREEHTRLQQQLDCIVVAQNSGNKSEVNDRLIAIQKDVARLQTKMSDIVLNIEELKTKLTDKTKETVIK
mgnify:CR=1 FL=1